VNVRINTGSPARFQTVMQPEDSSRILIQKREVYSTNVSPDEKSKTMKPLPYDMMMQVTRPKRP